MVSWYPTLGPLALGAFRITVTGTQKRLFSFIYIYLFVVHNTSHDRDFILSLYIYIFLRWNE